MTAATVQAMGMGLVMAEVAEMNLVMAAATVPAGELVMAIVTAAAKVGMEVVASVRFALPELVVVACAFPAN